MVEIVKVTTKKQQKEFVDFPLKMYKNNPYFVPPLYADELQIFRKDYMYNDQADAVYFNAYKNGKMVGRISGILQKAANLKWNQSRVRFTRFDSINDQEVADALFEAVENWGREQGMTEIVGPLGFSDLEREGLLIEGFDELATFEEQYNADYYQTLIENRGYGKDVDWFERQLRVPEGGFDPRVKRVSEMMMKKYNLHYGTARNTKEFVKKYVDKLFDLWDEAYSKIYGTVPFTEKVKKQMLANFMLVVDMRFIGVVCDENERVVAFGIVFPSMAKAVQKSSGKMTPCTAIKLLHDIKHPKIVDFALIGVTEEYKNKAISTALLSRFFEVMVDLKIEYVETNLTLEYNRPIQNLWKHFDARLHKRRRCYIKQL